MQDRIVVPFDSRLGSRHDAPLLAAIGQLIGQRSIPPCPSEPLEQQVRHTSCAALGLQPSVMPHRHRINPGKKIAGETPADRA